MDDSLEMVTPVVLGWFVSYLKFSLQCAQLISIDSNNYMFDSLVTPVS